MRQFLLAGNEAYATATDLSSVASGAIGVYYNSDGEIASSAAGTEFKGEGMLVLGRDLEKGGPIVVPIHTNNFSFVKGEYSVATTFTATVTIPEPTSVGDYSLIVVKKGVKFNERNKWTAMVHITDTSVGAEIIADKLVTLINGNSSMSEVSASNEGATITIEAVKPGKDYSVLGADELFGVDVTSVSGIPAYGDVSYVRDLAEKAAADAGFEYTYRDAYYYLYPDYPLNPLKQDDAADTGFTIFTLRFAEPRNTKTTDEAINQIVQIAFPTGASAITTFETVCKGLAGLTA